MEKPLVPETAQLRINDMLPLMGHDVWAPLMTILRRAPYALGLPSNVRSAVPAAQSNNSVLVPLNVSVRSMVSPEPMVTLLAGALTFWRTFCAKPSLVSVTVPAGELLLKMATSAAVGALS